jgi:transcriptional regulator with XRE-family HTH domain
MMTSDELLKAFGARVRDLRAALRLSQEELAFRSGLDRTYISDIERGRRNLSLLNIHAIAQALQANVATLFGHRSIPSIPEGRATERLSYILRQDFQIDAGFIVNGPDILAAAEATAIELEQLPFSLFKNIDLKTLSAMVGALFSANLALQVGALVNPIEKGHPDIIPLSGASATEAQLRNYPFGLEIKCTVGNVRQGSGLGPGNRRLGSLVGLTWQAHHREVSSLLGLVIDFAGSTSEGGHYPIVTAAFYTNRLSVTDWGEISGTTGRNTKVTGMRVTGRSKMGQGWVIIVNDDEYIRIYSQILGFTIS